MSMQRLQQRSPGRAPRTAALLGRAPFDPRQIPGCKLWLSAEHLVTPRGTAIGSWLDASGHDHGLTQSTSSKKPTFGGESYNLIPWSEELDRWATNNASVTTDAAVAPGGSSTAEKLVEDSSDGKHLIRGSLNFTSTPVTFSVFLKQAEREWGIVNPNGGGDAAWFDLKNGVVGAIQGDVADSGIEPANNGFFRCWVVSSAVSTSTAFPEILLADADNSNVYQGDGSSGIYVWGAQFVEGSDRLPYQRTGPEPSANARLLHFDGADDFLGTSAPAIADLHETENWCLGAWFRTDTPASRQAIIGSLKFGVSVYEFGLIISGGGDAGVFLRDQNNNASFVVAGSADTDWHFLVANRKPGVFECWQDGVKQNSASTNITKTNNANRPFRIGGTYDGVDFFNGRIHSAYAFNRGLTDNEIAMLYNKTKGLVV